MLKQHFNQDITTDANDAGKNIKDKYINSMGNGPSHHTKEFMNGYGQGFKACAGPEAQRYPSSRTQTMRALGRM